MDGGGQDPLQSAGRRHVRCMQGVRQCQDPRHRQSLVPGALETGDGGSGCPDQPIDPEKRGVVDPIPEGGDGPKAQRVEDLRSP